MPGTIDSLQIQITASSSRAVTSLTKLTAAIEGVKTALSGGFSNNLKESLDSIGTDGEQKLKHLAEALSGLKSIGKIQISQESIANLRSLIDTASSVSEDTIRNMERLSDALSGLSGLDFRGLQTISAANGLGEIGAGAATAGEKAGGGFMAGLRGGLKDATKQTTTLKKLFSSLGRVAFYRLIRSAIKAVTDALKEGTENVYKFSQAFGDSTAGVETIAQAYDRLASAGSMATNQLGAAWASLVRAITPMLLQLIDLATRAAAALTMLFAALGGSGTYLKASASDNKKWAQSAGGAAAAAKEWKNQLLGFDEINRLEEPSSGGGGGGGGLPEDFANMFEIAEIEDWAKRAADLISSISITIDDVFFEWKNLNGEQIAKKIITGLGILLGAVTGFMFGGVPGAIKGAIAGAALGVGFSSVVFDNDGVISRGEVAEMLRGALFALCGGVIGFTVGGVKGALLGAQIGLGVDMLLQAGNFISGGKWSGFITNLTTALNVATGAMLGFKLGGVGGAIIGASIGLGIDFLLKDFLMQDTSGWTPAQYAKTIIAALAPTAGTMIGFMLGGPGGALIGAMIGFGIQFGIKSFLMGDRSGWTPADYAKAIIQALAPAAGAMIGFALGGPGGALIGAAIGVGLKFAISNFHFSDLSGWVPANYGKAITTALAVGGGALIGFVVGGPGGALIGAAIGLGIQFGLKSFLFKDSSGSTPMSYAKTIVNALAPAAGALIGFAVGGPGGALLGVTIGLGIKFGISDFLMNSQASWTPADFAKAIIANLAPAAGAMIGFALGGPGGALIGLTVGIGLRFLIKNDLKVDGEDIVNGLESGITTAGEAKSWFQSLWEEIPDNAEIMWGIASPSTVFKTLGEYLIEGLELGLKTKFPIITQFFSETLTKLKTTVTEKWDEIKTKVTTTMEGMRSTISLKLDSIKTNMQTKWENMKSNTTTKWEELKTTITTKAESIRSNVSTKFQSMTTTVLNKWDDLKSKASEKWESIKSTISGMLEQIKSLFNFTWSLPAPRLPHIEWSSVNVLGMVDIPYFYINWYAKGGIFDQASLIGVGENGKEAVMPLEHNTGWIRDLAGQIADYGGTDSGSTADAVEESGDEIVNAILSASMQIISAMRETGGGEVDFDRFVRRVTKTQNRQARAAGVA